MNFLFSSSSSSSNTNGTGHPALTCNTTPSSLNAAAAAAPNTAGSTSPTTPSTSHQDIELLIEIETSFHGVLLGMPEESAGAVLNATAILHVRKKPIRASKLTATFDGRIKVQCSDGATFGPEQYRERVLAHKDWVLWESGNNTLASTSGSKNHIPVGTHYYPLSIQLDGALPPSFSGKHGSIRYILSTSLLRPLFYSDIDTVKEIEIRRCLVAESARNPSGSTYNTSGDHDLGSLFLNQLSRTGISESIEGPLDINALGTDPTVSSGPTTITHHNTHKELLRYTASSPPIAYLEGGVIHVDLALEPLPPGSYIYSISYGIKELIHYRSSATGNLADNKFELLYPIGQQTVIIPRDQDRERSMSSAGAGASTRQLLELRPCPLLTNVDTSTPLIDIQHRITCNVVVVLANPIQRRNTLSGGRSLGQSDGGGNAPVGGILRRLNLAPQPVAPNLDLIDSTGTAVANNAVLLGEPTMSIIEPVSSPASVELNDAPPPPPSANIESTLLDFPIILTSRYPSPPKEAVTRSVVDNVPIAQTSTQSAPVEIGNDDDGFLYQPLSTNSYSSSHLASSMHSRPGMVTISAVEQPSPTPAPQQFVHNQEIASTVVPTTGTAVPISTPSTTSTGTISGRPSHELHEVLPSVQLQAPLVPLPITQPSVSTAMTTASTQHRSGISAGLLAEAAAAVGHLQGSPQSRPPNPVPLSRPPSYGPPTHHLPQGQVEPSVQQLQGRPEEPPKYEDVIEGSTRVDSTEHGLGITIPSAMPVPMPMTDPRHRDLSVSPRSHYPIRSSLSQSPVLHQGFQSVPRNAVMASSPRSSFSSSPISPSMDDDPTVDQDGRGSSPRIIRGHHRSGSSTSVLMSTSVAQSQGMMAMGNQVQSQSQAAHRQSSLCRHNHHQRQRSIGAATIIGSLGRNGGYLSQQPVPLAPVVPLVDHCMVASSGRVTSPPSYVE